jgi:CubicO group peptidase (beta-lactamase class C family)
MRLLQLFILALSLTLVSCGTKNSANTTSLESYLDSLIQSQVDQGKIAGAGVAVYRGSEKILVKGYGYADLEFNVPMPADATFEIGSITKQFTGVAILQLLEEGKLSLDDDFTKYVKFDTQGKKITIRQLLSHTSGIESYTDTKWFKDLMIEKHKRDTLLRIIEKEKFDFEPGDALIYNNTGFFILGLIIEKVSGMTYEAFIQKNCFDKAGMKHAYYGSESRVIKNRAHGYDFRDSVLHRTRYLDHTWPYAAGSLCASTEDLVLWNQALHHGKILSDSLYQEFLNPYVLNDGNQTRYAKGITVVQDHGRKMIEHAGGINGFISENRFYPEEDLSIVVLYNTAGPENPITTADRIADKLLPVQEQDEKLFSGNLNDFTGTYQGTARGIDASVSVFVKDTSLYFSFMNDTSKLQHDHDQVWRQGNNFLYFKPNQLDIDQAYGYYRLKKAE